MGVKEELEKIRKDAEKLAKEKKDFKAAQQCLHDECCLMRPGHEPIIGKANAEAKMKEMMDKCGGKIPFHLEKVVDSCTPMGSDWAMERGHWVKDNDTGHFLTVWKKEGGTWKMMVDCSNVLKKE